MEYEWDAKKARTNIRDHGIDFADAVIVFEDDAAITVGDESSEEERFVTMGADQIGRALVVVYTWRGDKIRIISARKATKQERNQYKR
jgi:uncharacterized DUF497 family protein